MTMGPDPITSTDFRSSRLGTTHPRLSKIVPHGASPGALEQGAEVVEVVGSVVRSWSGFRVVLHAEHRALEQAQALDHAVVEVDVADRRRAERRLERLPRRCRDVRPGGRPLRFRGNGGFPGTVRYSLFSG